MPRSSRTAGGCSPEFMLTSGPERSGAPARGRDGDSHRNMTDGERERIRAFVNRWAGSPSARSPCLVGEDRRVVFPPHKTFARFRGARALSSSAPGRDGRARGAAFVIRPNCTVCAMLECPHARWFGYSSWCTASRGRGRPRPCATRTRTPTRLDLSRSTRGPVRVGDVAKDRPFSSMR